MDNFLKLVGAFVVIAGLSLLFAWPLMLIINYVFAPSLLLSIFGTAQITFWKTFALG